MPTDEDPMALPSVIVSPDATEPADQSGERNRDPAHPGATSPKPGRNTAQHTAPPAPPAAPAVPPSTGGPAPAALPPSTGGPAPAALPPSTGGPAPVAAQPANPAPHAPAPYGNEAAPAMVASGHQAATPSGIYGPGDPSLSTTAQGYTAANPPPQTVPPQTVPPQTVPPVAANPVRFGLRAYGATDVGVQRDVNEDAFYADDSLGLYVVCDGMGGHASGQVASNLALRTLTDAIKTGNPPPEPGEEPLVAAMKAANAAVYQRAQVDAACRGMGTTAVGIRAEEDLVHLCHCGDSRAYLLRGGQLTQMTEDHSLINLYKQRPDLVGQLGPATSNVIIRAIGLDTKVEIDHRTVAMEHGDVYLLCCDGLSDLVADWMIREIMTSGDTIEVVTANLIRAANANGGTDNITVIVIQIFDERQLYG